MASARERAIRVGVVADGAFLRRGVKELLAGDERVQLLFEARADGGLEIPLVHNGDGAHGDGAPETLVGRALDVLVIYAGDSPSLAGETARAFADRHSHAALVVLVMSDDPLLCVRLLEAGALGIVLIDDADQELRGAIVAAASGESFTTEAVQRRLDTLRASLVDELLSAREMEVLWLIARGFTSSEVAAQLGLSTRTIEAHRARMSRKLGTRSRADLVSYALERGLLRV